MNKYRSTKTELDGRSFASKLEASVYTMLKGIGYEILQCQDHVYLTKARILYIADFKVKNILTGIIKHAEAKGYETSDWRIKRKLWQYYGPNNLLIFKGIHTRPYLDEELVVKSEKM